MRVLPGWVWRDDWLAPAFGQPVSQFAGVVGSVGDQALRRRDAFEQGADPGEVVNLTGGHCEGHGAADVIGQGVNLGRPSAARSSDRVFVFPPFAPAAERCAFTWVESTAVVLITPLEPDRA